MNCFFNTKANGRTHPCAFFKTITIKGKGERGKRHPPLIIDFLRWFRNIFGKSSRGEGERGGRKENGAKRGVNFSVRIRCYYSLPIDVNSWIK